MVPILSLWLPILLGAVLVFAASFLIHMVLGYHKTDYRQLPSEDAVMDALRGFDIPPGEYVMPYAGSSKEYGSPEFIEKCEKGPMAFVTFMAPGKPKMGGQLAMWFVFSIIVGILAAYVAGRALGPGAEYLSVFRFTGATAFIAYTVAAWPASIWYKRAWSTTAKNTLDGFIYALLTAGAFGWLWPA
jgi:hypothetical protein